jgi:hypothetical protein
MLVHDQPFICGHIQVECRTRRNKFDQKVFHTQTLFMFS